MSEPTERDRELAARHCLHHARGDEDCTCADLERDFAQARAEEREAILAEGDRRLRQDIPPQESVWIAEFLSWVQARGKGGEGDADSSSRRT